MIFGTADLLRPIEYDAQPVTFVQAKHDGLRALVIRERGGEVHVLSREGKTDFWPKLMAIPHIAGQILRLPEMTAVDCELDAPGVQATEIKTLVNNADHRLRLTAFALPVFSGVDLRNRDWSVAAGHLVHLSFPVVETFAVGGEIDVAALVERARANGLEGYVAKRGHYAGWYKIKPVRTVDCVVISTTLSTSDSFSGGLKAVQVGVFENGQLKQIASVSSGFEAGYRLSVDRDSLVGQVCEIAYDSIAGKGQLKFPRFVRWRDDKPAPECTADQLPKAIREPFEAGLWSQVA